MFHVKLLRFFIHSICCNCGQAQRFRIYQLLRHRCICFPTLQAFGRVFPTTLRRFYQNQREKPSSKGVCFHNSAQTHNYIDKAGKSCSSTVFCDILRSSRAVFRINIYLQRGICLNRRGRVVSADRDSRLSNITTPVGIAAVKSRFSSE